MKKIAHFLIAILLYCSSANAQTTTITTAAPGNTGYAGDIWIGSGSTITFAVENANSHDIILRSIEDFKSTAGPGFPASPAGFYLWYSSTSLTGNPGQITQPAWSKLSGDTATIVNMVPGYNTIFSNLNFVIPANTTYRFALECTTGLAYSGIGSPNILTKDSVSLILANANNVGFAGNYPNSSYPNSSFTGSITFESAIPCNAAPIAGATVASVANVCSAVPFQLDLSGYSSGLGQTYQWQSSLNNTNWTNITAATASSATVTQSLSSFYRCAITCSGNTAYSAPIQVNTPLGVSGNYTINKGLPTGGTNFNTFTEAVNYVSCGVNGPVVFTVVPGSGPYSEQISIPFIGGTSSTNTITFKGKGETLFVNNIANTNLPIIALNGADHIVIDSLILDCSASSYGWGILFTNMADSNVVKNCTILNDISSSSVFAYNGILFNGSSTTLSASGNNGNYNLITNNTIVGGTYSIYLWGDGTGQENIGNKIINNMLKDFSSYAIYASYLPNGLTVVGNDISRYARTASSSTSGGVYIGTGCLQSLVEKNRIHNLFDAMSSNTSTCYAIYIGGVASIGKENRVINNLIYNMNGRANYYGVYNSGASNMLAYHNTIVFDDLNSSTGASYGFGQSGSAVGIEFKNNVISITRGGTSNQRCFNFATITSSIASNNNAVYINCPGNNAANVGLFGSLSYATLADWKLVNNAVYDQQSVEVNPVFITAANEYIPTAAALNDIGVDVGITDDILNVSRSNFPDPGAYEFTSAPCSNTISPGVAISSTANICPDKLFTLGLTGNSIGAGQLYQWQSSSNNINWINVGNATPNSSISTSQLGSNYYRCAIQCGSGGTTFYSTTIQVVTPSYLSGNFTINKNATATSTNFQTFSDAINAVQCGINGPVVFNVIAGSGPYYERFTIPQITGASATNTITIKGNGETLSYTSSDANNKAGIILNGADHIVLDSLTVDVSGGTYSWGILLTNQSDSNIIKNCTIISSTTSTNQNAMGIYFNGSSTALSTSGNIGSYNTILNNTVIGGYYGIYLYGNSSSTSQNTNNIIKGNVLKDMYSYGVYTMYQPVGLVITGNDISRPTRTNTTSAAGIYVYTGSLGVLVEKNKVHNLFDLLPTSTQVSYGIFIGSDATTNNPNKVINNLVYNMNGNGIVYGMMCSFGNNVKLYHNTIVLDDQTATTGNTFGFHQPVQATGMDFRNNLVYVSRSGSGTKTCISIGSSASSFISNNNVFYIPSTVTGRIGTLQGGNYITLADWKGANGGVYDQASVSDDPLFVSSATANYKPTAAAVDNIGFGLGVATDIVNTARSIGLPDAGAYEFGSILPVSLLNLRGYRNGNVNTLQWTTLTENNCTGFELLRSNNNNDFSKITFLNTKAVNGTSNAMLSYSFEDVFATTNNTYYKLKQVDIDGKFSFSNTVLVKNSKAINLEIIAIYPNPVNQLLNIAIASPAYYKAKLIVADVYGKIILQKPIVINTGDNNATVLVDALAAGNYTIKLLCDNGCETTVKKFVKR
ncbi:MAG: T9SS type A sorting domain-containing protein [Chitinophagaceae bacterium]